CAARYVVAAGLCPSNIQETNNPSRSSQGITAETPSPLLRLVNTNGRVSRIFFASRRITSRSAPIAGARSILLITNKSERVTPGPPCAEFYRRGVQFLLHAILRCWYSSVSHFKQS